MTTNTTGEDSDGPVTEPPNSWLSQGDVFQSVPILGLVLDEQLRAEIQYGPAMLMTHGCAMDKPSGRSLRPRVPHLHFAPVRSILTLTRDRQFELRRRRWRVDPSQVAFLGELPDIGEGYANFSEVYALPAEFFDLTLEVPHEAPCEPARLRLRSDDVRIASLTSDAAQLVRLKLAKYWARLQPNGGP